MIGDLQKQLGAVPFVPFEIVTSGGVRYPIPTRDHLNFNPKRTRAVVWFDDGSSVIISPLHVTALEVQPSGPQNGAA